MPSTHSTIGSPNIELAVSEKMSLRAEHDRIAEPQQTPRQTLDEHAQKWQLETASEAFAHKLDEIDPLRHVRQEFFVPKMSTLPKGKTLTVLRTIMKEVLRLI